MLDIFARLRQKLFEKHVLVFWIPCISMYIFASPSLFLQCVGWNFDGDWFESVDGD
jgi:hypothetical protein